MAGIVCQPQVAFDKFGTAGTVAEAVEKTDGSIRIVKMAEGFRFQPQLHQSAGLPAQHIQESAHGVQPGEDASPAGKRVLSRAARGNFRKGTR